MALGVGRSHPKTSVLALALIAALAAPAAHAEATGDDRIASALDMLDLPTYQQAQSEGAGQATLAGLILDGQDMPVALSVREAAAGADASASVEALLRGLGLEPLHLADGSWEAQTPLGLAQVPRTELQTRNGVDYATLPALERALGIALDYDPTAAAVIAITTWSLLPKASTPPDAEIVRPDAEAAAPRTSLSYWRTEAYFNHSDNDNQGSIATDVGGGMAGGFWRARYEDDLESNRAVRDYAWIRTDGQRRWLLGNQQVSSHPLLNSFDLTGGQMAWTNRPENLYGTRLDYGELVSGRTAPSSNLRGNGPLGGVAELLYDGVVVARVPVALDGRYEFRDIPLSRGTSTRVEVALYENGSLGTPMRIEDRSGQASDLLLAQGTVLHYMGAGQLGNPLDPDDLSEGSGAFYEGRFGVLPGLTLDVSGQHIDGRDVWLAGGVASLGVAGVYSAHAASTGDAEAWQIDGEGFRGRAFWRLLAREEDAGFRIHDASTVQHGLEERYAEGGWRGDKWAFGVVGRDISGGVDTVPVSYVKPSVEWYPRTSLYFSARPDLAGNYEYSTRWAVTPTIRLGAYLAHDSDRYELDKRISPTWRANLSRIEYQGRNRHSLLFAKDRRDLNDLGFAIAALESEGKFGYLASMDKQLYPGVSLRVQAYDDPLAIGQGPVVQIGLVADFAVTPQGLAAGRYSRGLDELGGVSGNLTLPGEEVADFAAAGAAVWVDGQRRAEVDENGRFNVRDMEPGVYQVKVDEGLLPIEMRLEKSDRWVEVRAGVVTPVQFPLSLQLGFAGRALSMDGTPLAGLALSITDADGAQVAQATSDAWGYYRVDGLSPGRYQVVLQDGGPLHAEPVELSKEFRFGVDLRTPAAPPSR